MENIDDSLNFLIFKFKIYCNFSLSLSLKRKKKFLWKNKLSYQVSQIIIYTIANKIKTILIITFHRYFFSRCIVWCNYLWRHVCADASVILAYLWMTLKLRQSNKIIGLTYSKFQTIPVKILIINIIIMIGWPNKYFDFRHIYFFIFVKGWMFHLLSQQNIKFGKFWNFYWKLLAEQNRKSGNSLLGQVFAK